MAFIISEIKKDLKASTKFEPETTEQKQPELMIITNQTQLTVSCSTIYWNMGGCVTSLNTSATFPATTSPTLLNKRGSTVKIKPKRRKTGRFLPVLRWRVLSKQWAPLRHWPPSGASSMLASRGDKNAKKRCLLSANRCSLCWLELVSGY